MLMYVKLFASLYQGTLRGCSDEILVFTNLLAHADQHGVVDKHWRAISEETGLDRERVEKAIQTLESPDSESRSPEHGGRRIMRLDEHRAWGWQIVNYGKYRAIRNEDDRREQNRLAQERFRNKNNKSNQSKPPSSQAEEEADTEAKASKTKKQAASAFELPEWIDSDAWNGFVEMRQKLRKPMTDRAKVLMVAKLKGFKAGGHDVAALLNKSTVSGWTDVYAPDSKTQPLQTVFNGSTAEAKPGESMEAYTARLRAMRP